MTFINTQDQLNWIFKVSAFETNNVAFAGFHEVEREQDKLKARLAQMPAMFDQGFIDAIPEVNSYGHNMAKLDQVCAELMYYVNETAEAKTAHEIEEATAYFEYILEDFFKAAEAAAFNTNVLDALEDDETI